MKLLETSYLALVSLQDKNVACKQKRVRNIT
jgi:hypothetical protein